MQDQIELVARAFYAVEYVDAWEDAPESVKTEHRRLAREAIAMLKDQRDEIRSIVMSAVTPRTGPEAS